jgi:hypothetical protein
VKMTIPFSFAYPLRSLRLCVEIVACWPFTDLHLDID